LTGGDRRAHNRGMEAMPSQGRQLRELIDALVADGATLREIELEVIATAPVGTDARDALWLYAWGCLERQRPSVAA
jgi:hypothetical protein